MNRAVALRLALVLVSAAATRLAAQAPTDTTHQARDTTAARDTTPRDTLPALLPTFEPAIAPGPLPAGTRYTFNADSLLLSGTRTLSDLLLHIPGVYVARGGWYGQAEIVLYGGRGPASLEVYWDGVPLAPLGRDSVYLDPARIPIGPLERVDVVVLPATLQVYLVTDRHRSTAPRTQVGIISGLQDIANYRAGYSKRARSGLGVSLLADWNSIGQGAFSSTTTPFGSSDLWLKVDWVPPDGRVGAAFQISSASWHRTESGPVSGWRQDRRDRLLRLFLAQRGDGTGWRLTTTLATSAISHDTALGTAGRALSLAILEASEVLPRATLAATARVGTAGFPQQLEARGGWIPIAPLTLAGFVRQSAYSNGRAGTRGYLTAGLALPLGFSARAEAAWQRDLQAPLIASDRVQQTVDVAAWVGFHSRRLTVEVGRGRRDPFAPLGFAQGIGTVDSLAPTPATEFAAGHGSLLLVPGLTLDGWYFAPVTGGGDFEPPHHGRVSLTFYSKFWRVFPSGIFALRGEVAMESWGSWPFGGIDTTVGGERPLTGSSFVDTHLEIQLAGVTLFWSIQNVNLMRSSYVNGLGFPRAAQQYGARWFFTN